MSKNIEESLRAIHSIVCRPQLVAVDVKECMMQKIETREEDLVDLGVATEETKGGIFGVLDQQQSLELTGGISDE